MVLLGFILIAMQGGMILAPLLENIWYLGSIGLVMVLCGIYMLNTKANVKMLKGDGNEGKGSVKDPD